MSVGLTITGLHKCFGSHQALAGVDLEIKPGEFFTLLGPSGCGKTTLLRCVAGFCRPDAGEIVCAGERLDPLPPYRRNLGMVFQNYALFPHLSVHDNVAYGLRARGAAAGLVSERVRQALEMVQLTGKGDRSPGQLSGGEQQRVATARALAIEPRLLLMDEPLSNLDAKLRVQMREDIRRVQRSLGITTLYVTHDQEEALALSDRLAVMNAGRLEQVGNPLEIYRYPATPFVAGFIGHTNFLHGRVEQVEAGRAVVLLEAGAGEAAATVTVPAGQLAPGQAVTLAVRPERLGLQEGENALAGEVETVTFLGSVTRLQVRTAAGSLQVELRSEASELQPGVQATVGFPPEAATVFPQAG